MEHTAKSKATRIKTTAAPSKNAIVTKTIEELFADGREPGRRTLPEHTGPTSKELYGYVLARAETISRFEKDCERRNISFFEGVRLALEHYPFHLDQKKSARKKYRQRRERDQDRAVAFLGDFYDEIMEADRLKRDVAEFRFEDSLIPVKPITDAEFLSGLRILDDGLGPN